MRKLMDSLDMTGNEIINVSMQKITSFPTDNLFTGRLIYLESESEETPSGYYYYNGEEWVSIGSGGSGDEKSSIVIVETLPDNAGISVNKFEELGPASTYTKSNNNPKNIIINTSPDITNLEGYFSSCTSLESVIICNGVLKIGSGAFSNCKSLKSVIIPNTVTKIDSAAFIGCTSLTSIDIPNSVVTIGGGVFSGTSITSIIIPSSVTSLSGGFLDRCESITIPTRYVNSIKNMINTSYLKEINITADNTVTTLNNRCLESTGIEHVTLPDNLTSIDTAVFSGCTSLKSVTIPNGVTTINSGAFTGCTSLESIDIPNSVTSIGVGAFVRCEKLKEVNISNGITILSNSIFASCKSLESVTIPNGVTTIDTAVFSGCTSLKSVTIPNTVTSIGSSAFGGCSSLKSITIPDSVTTIYGGAFVGCDIMALEPYKTRTGYPWGATNIYIQNEDVTTTIDENSTDRQVPTAKTVYDALSSSGGSSLDDTKINVIDDEITVHTFDTLSDAKTYINSNSKPKSVIIGSNAGITSIGNTAFMNCTSLTSITIPSGVTSIDFGAFSGCTSLKSITIPNSVKSIGDIAFSGCTSLTSITIPDSVTSIGNYVFNNCESLTSITIPSRVTNIRDATFMNCTSLTSVTIPSSVTSIGSSAFSGCTSLTGITIPSGVTNIYTQAFNNCTSLKSITIPSGVTNIRGNTFNNCTSLTSITIPNSVTNISGAFNNCTSLKSITIPSGVTIIDNNAFANCTSLTSINIPSSVTSIGNYAFSGCASLKSISIPNTVTSIGNTAFSGCDILALEPYKTRTGYPWGATSILIQNEDVTTTIDANSTDRQVPTAKAVYNFTGPIFGIRYGFRINKNNSDPDTRVEYLYDAVGMTPAKMTYDETTHKGTFDYGSWGNVWFIKNNRPVKLNFNGTVEAELNPNNYWETVDGQDSELETSTNCNFMSEIPIVYVKRWEDENYNYVVVCDKQYDEDYLAYANTDKDGNLKPLYAPMFKGYKDSNNILRSIAGVDPMNNAITSNEVMYSNNINTAGSVTGWQIEDVAKHELISDLLTLISKNTDSQTVFGNGACQTSTRVFTGYNEIVTNTKTVKSDCGQFCGYNDNVHHVNIFHIQDFWGNRFDRCLGLITSGGKYYYKMTPENGGYVYSETITDYTNNGYNIAQDYSSSDITPPASGYIKNQSTGIFGNLPNNATGASDSTYYCDYYYYNSSGVRLLILGGSYDNGRRCGSRCFGVLYAPSYAYVYLGASPFYV